jgi:hypothetical protein
MSCSLAFWAWFWGIADAAIAVPVLVTTKVFSNWNGMAEGKMTHSNNVKEIEQNDDGNWHADQPE